MGIFQLHRYTLKLNSFLPACANPRQAMVGSTRKCIMSGVSLFSSLGSDEIKTVILRTSRYLFPILWLEGVENSQFESDNMPHFRTEQATGKTAATRDEHFHFPFGTPIQNQESQQTHFMSSIGAVADELFWSNIGSRLASISINYRQDCGNSMKDAIGDELEVIEAHCTAIESLHILAGRDNNDVLARVLVSHGNQIRYATIDSFDVCH